MATTAAPPLTRSLSRPQAPQAQRPAAFVNVGDSERWLSLVGGGALALLGLSRRSLGGLALAAVGSSLVYRGVSGHCSMYQTLGVNTADEHGPATSVRAGHGFKVEQSMTINRPAAELYRFWHNFANLGRFMQNLESVTIQSPNRSHWVARGPLGKRVEWDAEIHNERENELIAWRSLEGSEVDTAGSVHFQQLSNNRGTEVRVVLKYDPPAGKLGSVIAGLFGASPESLVREDLRRFKQLMEAGEVPTTRGQPQGSCSHC